MKILITGGAGYIGSIATRLFLDAGHECVVLDNLTRGFRAAVDPRAKFHRGDVGNRLAVSAALQGCDAVVHFAGLIDVAESQREPEKYFDFNTTRPTVLLQAMAEQGVGRMVFSSTAAVYGEPEEIPILEDAPKKPINAYGESKLAFEKKLDEFDSQGIRSIRFRYFNVAGAWEDGRIGEAHEHETHIIPRVLAAMRDGQERFEVFGGDYPTPDGTCVRDYIHVVDLANAHLLGLERLEAGGSGDVFNLGNGKGFSNRQVVETCAEVTGKTVDVEIGPRRKGDPAMLVASSEKAERELGWKPTRPELGTIVEDAWRWHLAHPSGYR